MAIIAFYVACVWEIVQLIEIHGLDLKETWTHKVNKLDDPVYLRVFRNYYWAAGAIMMGGAQVETTCE